MFTELNTVQDINPVHFAIRVHSRTTALEITSMPSVQQFTASHDNQLVKAPLLTSLVEVQ